MIEGYFKNEICNREGCTGVIDEIELEGCSCHNNPPCSYCTTNKGYCDTCGWDGEEEQNKLNAGATRDEVETFVKGTRTNKIKYEYNWKPKRLEDLDKTKVDWIAETHTYSSMKKIGVYPAFGGRFTRFDKGEFEYIAYTD